MASPRVGSAIHSCQLGTGSWLVTMVAARPCRSSTISSRSRRCSGVSGVSPQSSRTSSWTRARLLSSAGVAPVAARQAERLEQPRQALVEHAAVVAAGLVAEGAGQPGLADAGRAGEQQPLVAVDPFAGGQALEQGAVEAARGAPGRRPRRRPTGAGRRTSAGRAAAGRRARSPRGRPAGRGAPRSRGRPGPAGAAAPRAPAPCRRGRGRAAARWWGG